MEVRDWKGNKVKAGDTIFTVMVKSPPQTFKFCLLDWEKKDMEVLSETHHPEQNYLWIKGEEYYVHEIDGKLYYKFEDERGSFTIQLSQWIFEGGFKDSTILCIKGVSDSREEYYLEQFKVKDDDRQT